jgi:hypothetical protein
MPKARVASYSKRQQAQLKRFVEWVKTEGGVEGPTQLKTLFKPHQLARMQWLKENAAGYTLEVGCNWAAVLAYMGGHVGIDISPMNIELARVLSPDLEFHVGDAKALPFPDKAFQTVAIPETLEHLDFPDGVRLAIQEACRVSWQRVLVTMPDGTKDTEEATSFKHRFLLDAPTLSELLTMFPPGGRTSVEQAKFFVLIRHDLRESACQAPLMLGPHLELEAGSPAAFRYLPRSLVLRRRAKASRFCSSAPRSSSYPSRAMAAPRLLF